MPKFNPKQQQKKLRRHNPIARSSAAEGQATAPPQLKPSGSQQTSNDVIPLLNSLPLPPNYGINNVPPTSSSIEEDEKCHRALLSLNPLLLTKAERVALLAPKHKLLARLVYHLNHPRLEVRKEAAGCLRNLCVEGSWSGREEAWKLGAGAAALAQIDYAAQQLGFIPKQQEQAETVSASATASSVSASTGPKKLDEMNRKERRQAAKAQKITETRGNAVNLQDPALQTAPAAPASAAAEADAHDLHLLHLSLLENHLTIAWCLLEGVASPVWLSQLNRSNLGQLLCAFIARGAQSLGQSDVLESKIAQKEKKEVSDAEVDVAFTSANMLSIWLEDNPSAAATVAGLPLDLAEQVVAFEAGGNSSVQGTKSRRRLETILERFGNLDADSMAGAKARIDQLAETVQLLRDPSLNTKLDTRRLNLGLLSLASCTNLLASLPASLRSWVPAPTSSSSPTLTHWQVREAIPLLLQLVLHGASKSEIWASTSKAGAASDGQMDVDNEASKEQGGSSLSSRQVDVATLAVELMGEICAEADADDPSLLPFASGADHNGDMDGVDSGMGDDDDDDLDSDQEEEMLALAGGEEDEETMETDRAQADKDNAAQGKPAGRVNQDGWPSSPQASLVSTHNLANSLLQAISAPVFADAVSSEASPSSTTDFVLASHNAIASLLSGIAAHAKPPPSHPVEPGSRKAAEIRRFQGWAEQQSNSLAASYEELKSWSTRLSAQVKDSSSETVSSLLVPVWTSLNALAVMHEGCPRLPNALTDVSSLTTFYQPSLELYLKNCTDESFSSCASLVISTLAYLSRNPSSSPNDSASSAALLQRNQYAASAFLTILQSTASLPASSSPTPILPIIATLNHLTDTYADETSPYDVPSFRQGNVLSSLKGFLMTSGFNQRIKAVDKRKYAEERSRAEEAWSMLEGFVEYRESLGF